MANLEITFSAKLWVYPGKARWHFATLPEENQRHIKDFQEKHIDFGAVRVRAKIGKTEWETSLFSNTNSPSYHLPVKTDVRKKEKIAAGDQITVHMLVGI